MFDSYVRIIIVVELVRYRSRSVSERMNLSSFTFGTPVSRS
jgi:hypothetical protein